MITKKIGKKTYYLVWVAERDFMGSMEDGEPSGAIDGYDWESVTQYEMSNL